MSVWSKMQCQNCEHVWLEEGDVLLTNCPVCDRVWKDDAPDVCSICGAPGFRHCEGCDHETNSTKFDQATLS